MAIETNPVETPKSPVVTEADKLREAAQKGYPPAGPHAREDLTDHDKTPGTGALHNPERPYDTDGVG